MIKVCKFGGSSLADAERILNLAETVLSDKTRKYIVVSAFGKRFAEDEKITDCLIKASNEFCTSGKSESFLRFETRMSDVVNKLRLKDNLIREVHTVGENAAIGVSSAFLISRGEYFSARIIAEVLGFEFIDASEVIRFDYDGKINAEVTNYILSERLSKTENAVIPGFYGSDGKGNIFLFSRGGGDFSGSVCARAASTETYENFTDVNGIYAVNPKIVKNAEIVTEITRSEMRKLAFFGTEVLQPDCVIPLYGKNTVIEVKKYDASDKKGSRVVADGRESAREGIIAVTAKKHLYLYDGKISFSRDSETLFYSADCDGERLISLHGINNRGKNNYSSYCGMSLIFVMCRDYYRYIGKTIEVLTNKGINVFQSFSDRQGEGFFLLVEDEKSDEAVELIYENREKK